MDTPRRPSPKLLRLLMLLALFALLLQTWACGFPQFRTVFYYPLEDSPENDIQRFSVTITGENLQSQETKSFNKGEAIRLDTPACNDPKEMRTWQFIIRGAQGENNIAKGHLLSRNNCRDPQDLRIFISRLHAFSKLPVFNAEDKLIHAEHTANLTGHQVTLLADGRVLLTGGLALKAEGTPLEALGKGEIPAGAAVQNNILLYDPARGTLTNAGTLTQARAFHTATLLPDGKVLIAGGFDINADAGEKLQALDHVELLTLQDGKAQSTATPFTLKEARAFHTAQLLTLPNGGHFVFFFGGLLFHTPQNFTISLATSSESLALANQDQQQIPLPWPARRFFHTTTLLTDRHKSQNPNDATQALPILVVTGGIGYQTPNEIKRQSNFKALTSIIRVSLSGDTPSTLPGNLHLQAARAGHSATQLLDGRVVIAGGYHPSPQNPFIPTKPNARLPLQPTSTLELLSSTGLPNYPLLDDQSHLTIPPQALHQASLLPDGRLLLSGGFHIAEDGSLNTNTKGLLLLPTPSTLREETHPLDLHQPRFAHQAITLQNGSVLLFGGVNNLADSNITHVESFIGDPSADSGTDKIARCHPNADVQGIGACAYGRKNDQDQCYNAVSPGDETCNGIDDDCDGKTDEGSDDGALKQTCYTNRTGCKKNGNTYECTGTCSTGTQVCDKGSWGDCTGQVTPTKENCGNGKDDNCNGRVDDGCGCNPGDQQDCYSGPEGTAGKGICKQGTQTCTAERKWGPCEGDIKPATEICNNQDDNCDGKIDNDNQNPDAKLTQPCYGSDKGCTKGDDGTYKCNGTCKTGKQTCNQGQWSNCEQATTPQPEDCNGKDDDCDGSIDNPPSGSNALTRTCFTGKSGCKDDGQGGYTCNLPCKTGTQTCQNGQWTQECNAQTLPKDSEICGNNIDDDCDGNVDQPPCKCSPGEVRPCYPSVTTPGLPPGCSQDNQGGYTCNPVCKTGTQTCESTGTWSQCSGHVHPKAEECNGKDDDCDGKIDNKPNSTDPIEQACYNGRGCTQQADGTYKCLGECKTGTQVCGTGGQWKACRGETKPTDETCDNKDNNCDGNTDENLNGRTCYTKQAGCTQDPQNGAYSCTTPCKTGTLECKSGLPLCKGEIVPQTEDCNGIDDDCDGQVDNDPVPPNDCSNQNGACKGAKPRCLSKSGQKVWECDAIAFEANSKDYQATETRCDGIDNDCDGHIDNIAGGTDKLTQPCYPAGTAGCQTATGDTYKCQGVCKTGVRTCQPDTTWSACQGAVTPTLERCTEANGIKNDENCNGRIDEVCFVKIADTNAGKPFYKASFNSTDNRLGLLAYTGESVVYTFNARNTPPLTQLHTHNLPNGAGGIAFNRRPVTNSIGSALATDLVGRTGYLTADQESKGYFHYFNNNTPVDKYILNPHLLGKAGDITFAPRDNRLYALVTRASALKHPTARFYRYSGLGVTSNLELTYNQQNVELKGSGTSCQHALRITADYKDNNLAIVTCPEFELFAALDGSRGQKRFPNPGGVSTGSLVTRSGSTRIYFLNASSTSPAVDAVFSSDPRPVEAAIGYVEEKRYIVVSHLGNPVTTGLTPATVPSIRILTYDSAAKTVTPGKRFTFPQAAATTLTATSFTWPVSVKITKDGLVWIATQTFERKYDGTRLRFYYTPKSGQIHAFYLSELLSSSKTRFSDLASIALQSITLPNGALPDFMTIAPSNQFIAVPASNKGTVHIFRR